MFHCSSTSSALLKSGGPAAFLSASRGFLRCKYMYLLSHCRSIQKRSTPIFFSSNQGSMSSKAVTLRKFSLQSVPFFLERLRSAVTLRLVKVISVSRSSSYHCLISCSCSVNCTSVGFLRARLGFSCVPFPPGVLAIATCPL